MTHKCRCWFGPPVAFAIPIAIIFRRGLIVEYRTRYGHDSCAQSRILERFPRPGRASRRSPAACPLALSAAGVAAGSGDRAGLGQQKRTAHRRGRSFRGFGYGLGRVRLKWLLHAPVAPVRAERTARGSVLSTSPLPSPRREGFCGRQALYRAHASSRQQRSAEQSADGEGRQRSRPIFHPSHDGVERRECRESISD